jgi:hypothetical protein
MLAWQVAKAELKPRKLPTQDRAKATVDAIFKRLLTFF